MKNLKQTLWYCFLIFIAYTFYTGGRNIPGTIETAATVTGNVGEWAGAWIEHFSNNMAKGRRKR